LIEISCNNKLETISISEMNLPDLGLKIKCLYFEIFNYGWELSSLISLRTKHLNRLHVSVLLCVAIINTELPLHDFSSKKQTLGLHNN
jgi:hypothetical protein